MVSSEGSDGILIGGDIDTSNFILVVDAIARRTTRRDLQYLDSKTASRGMGG